MVCPWWMRDMLVHVDMLKEIRMIQGNPWHEICLPIPSTQRRRVTRYYAAEWGDETVVEGNGEDWMTQCYNRTEPMHSMILTQDAFVL